MVIRIHRLKVKTIIGINLEERENPQVLYISLEITIDSTKSAKSELIEDTVNYDLLTRSIIERIETQNFTLLEHFEKVIAKEVFKFDPRIQAAKIEIEKPNALKYLEVESVIVRQEYPQRPPEWS
jgi:FolB domain-containing protein